MRVSVTHVQALEDYRRDRLHLFPSPESLRWYLRIHRPLLSQAGALLKLRGRFFIHAENFDGYVIEAAQSAAGKQGHSA